jgi:hypothetical protein
MFLMYVSCRAAYVSCRAWCQQLAMEWLQVHVCNPHTALILAALLPCC